MMPNFIVYYSFRSWDYKNGKRIYKANVGRIYYTSLVHFLLDLVVQYLQKEEKKTIKVGMD